MPKTREQMIEYLMGEKSELHPMFGGTPNIRDLCYNIFMRAKVGTIPDPEDKEAFRDWFNDTLPMVEKCIAKWQEVLKPETVG